MIGRIRRRTFLSRAGAFAMGGLATCLSGAPTVLTARRVRQQTSAGRLVFRPTFVQAGRGPHLSNLVYATDTHGDVFHSDIAVVTDGIHVSDLKGERRFCANLRWNVEGFGYLFLTADNAGEGYALPPVRRHAHPQLEFRTRQKPPGSQCPARRGALP
jgi:hypothetical protein